MSHLLPEKRLDRNGRLVTRYVKPEGKEAPSKAIPHPVDPTARSSRYTCTQCKSVLTRGFNHRCHVPGLIPMSKGMQKVVDACKSIGGTPLLVGGCVRDALLSRSGKASLSKDIDMEVHDVSDPNVLVEALRRVGVVNEVGVSFGVLKMRVSGEDFDISLPRRDSKLGEGRRGFDTAFDASVDEVEAFGRRDFTINAMGYDPQTEELIDPFGGTADLSAGILRHPTEAFDESPVRVLRAVQFAARFEFDIAPETVARAQSLVDAFPSLPLEQVWGEFDKLFTKGRSISRGLQALYDCGWEKHFPELEAIRDVPQDPKWHPEGAVHVHSGLAGDAAVRIADREELDDESRRIAVLGATVHDFGKAEFTQMNEDGSITSIGHASGGVRHAKAFLKSIGAPASVIDKVCPIVKEHMCLHSIDGVPTASTVRGMMRRLSGESGRGPTIEDWARVVEADLSGRNLGDSKGATEVWLEVAANSKDKMKPILRGDHLMALNMKPGPEFGVIIGESLVAQDNGEFTDVEGAIEWLRRRVNNSQ